MTVVNPVASADLSAFEDHKTQSEINVVAHPTSAHMERRSDRPVDLVHLARQSLGDRSLELEILALFQSQSELYLDRLTKAKTEDEQKMAAHTILGSARGIGAWEVVREAEKIQNNLKVGQEFGSLRRAVDSARDYINSIL